MSQAATLFQPGDPAPPPTPLAPHRWSPGNFVLAALTRSSALAIVLMAALLVGVLTYAAMPSMRRFGAAFLIGTEWRPNELERPRLGPDGKMVMQDGETVIDTV